jgi:hypothetical protein
LWKAEESHHQIDRKATKLGLQVKMYLQKQSGIDVTKLLQPLTIVPVDACSTKI